MNSKRKMKQAPGVLVVLNLSSTNSAPSSVISFSFTSIAPRNDSDILLIVVMCIVFCFAIRHANDFYTGETVTLVEEGVWSGRYRHREDKRLLTKIEADFENMYKKLKDKATIPTKVESIHYL
ncbi:hypothetical protein OSTOST_02364 [Ostertagia ostertagi]